MTFCVYVVIVVRSFSYVVAASVVVLPRRNQTQGKYTAYLAPKISYLRVEEPVRITSRGRSLYDAVVATARVVHVAVAPCQRDGKDETKRS